MPIYVGINGVARRITDAYVGVNNKAKKLLYIYAGDANGIARLVHVNWRYFYQQVEYISGTGNQYINTEYIIKSNSAMEVKFQMNSVTYTNGATFFGGRENNSRFTIGIASNRYGSLGVGDGYAVTSARMTTSTIYTYVIDSYNKRILINGNYKDPYSGTYSAYTGTNTWLGILGCMVDGTLSTASVKCYSLKVKESDVLVHNYYPVYRKSDHVAGVFDVIDGKFYSNSGTGTISVGAATETIL